MKAEIIRKVRFNTSIGNIFDKVGNMWYNKNYRWENKAQSENANPYYTYYKIMTTWILRY